MAADEDDERQVLLSKVWYPKSIASEGGLHRPTFCDEYTVSLSELLFSPKDGRSNGHDPSIPCSV